jgi:hypothetical protein
LELSHTATGELFVEKDGEQIFLSEEPWRSDDLAIVRLFILVKKMPSRVAAKAFTEYLALAWETGCSVGTAEREGTVYLCCFATQLQTTFDSDEFALHLDGLLRLSKSLKSV